MQKNEIVNFLHIEDNDDWLVWVKRRLEKGFPGVNIKQSRSNEGLSWETIANCEEGIPQVIISDNNGIGELGIKFLLRQQNEINTAIADGKIKESQKPLLVLHSADSELANMITGDIKLVKKEDDIDGIITLIIEHREEIAKLLAQDL